MHCVSVHAARRLDGDRYDGVGVAESRPILAGHDEPQVGSMRRADQGVDPGRRFRSGLDEGDELVVTSQPENDGVLLGEAADFLQGQVSNDVEALDQLVTDGVTSLFQNTLISAVAQMSIGTTLALTIVYAGEALDSRLLGFADNETSISYAAVETAIGQDASASEVAEIRLHDPSDPVGILGHQHGLSAC